MDTTAPELHTRLLAESLARLWEGIQTNCGKDSSGKAINGGAKPIECPICGDTECVIADRERNIWRPCKCQEVKRQRRILARCGLSEAFRRKTLENYEERNEHAAAMKGMACDYAANTTGGALKSIGFFGQSGIGKTHLSIALANILMQKGIAVLYMPYVEKIKELKDLNRLQSRHDVEDACYDKAIAPLKTVRVLMIDDLFKRSEDRYNQANPADVRIMFEILNDRYLKGLPVIVSSELTLTEIIRIDEAFGGRLIEMCGEYCYEAEKDQRLNYRLKDVLGG